MRAHITRNEQGEVINQTVAEHCKNTAEYARDIMTRVGLGTIGYIAGLNHDIGKNEKFDKYIERVFNGEAVQRGSVNHTFAGVIKILGQYHSDVKEKGSYITQQERLADYLSEVIAFGIGAHHSLFDYGIAEYDGESGIEKRYFYDKDLIEYNAVLDYYNEHINTAEQDKELWEKAMQEFAVFYENCKAQIMKKRYNADDKINKQIQTRLLHFYIQCLMRHLVSAVSSADFRDTKEFMQQQKDILVKMDWEKNLNYFNERYSKFDKTGINAVRGQISDILYSQDVKSSGVYLLTLPTGSGKTLSAVRYALKVAKECNKDRIFYVAPLLSILNQNANVIKGFLAEKSKVLTHFTEIVRDNDYVDYREQKKFKEMWDSPFIITTLFQFLETCFKDGSAQVRRFNRLSNSVLIIDEVQQVPIGSIQLFNLMVNYLAKYCNVTVLLMTATQPHFELNSLIYSLDIDEDLTCEISKQVDLQGVFESRVIYDITKEGISPLGLGELVDFIKSVSKERNSVLVVCNTRTSCKQVYDLCCAKIDEGVKIYKLSRNMCEAEIADTLKAIRLSLNVGERVLCISTQLIEAGVDISFEAGIRLSAGLDNIIQTAGRINRHNNLSEKGVLYVRYLRDEYVTSLPEIADAQTSLHSLVCNKGFNMTDEDSLLFYNSFYNKCKDRLRIDSPCIKDATYNIVNRNTVFSIKNCMKHLGESYNVYNTGLQYSVLVPYGKYMETVERLKVTKDADVVQQLVNGLGMACVMLYESTLNRYIEKGIIRKYELENQSTLYIAECVDFE